jgi:multidrug efflux system membrane fusion protein
MKKVELEIARIQLEQQKIQLRFREAQLERNYLRAPFDGRVDDVSVDVGEVKKETERVARVVAVNPLWIDVPAPTGQTMTLALKPGDPAWVILDIPGEARVSRGKIIEVGAEADPASNTRRVRVELPNPTEHPAGLTAWVRFQPPTGGWSARTAPEGPTLTAEKPR